MVDNITITRELVVDIVVKPSNILLNLDAFEKVMHL